MVHDRLTESEVIARGGLTVRPFGRWRAPEPSGDPWAHVRPELPEPVED